MMYDILGDTAIKQLNDSKKNHWHEDELNATVDSSNIQDESLHAYTISTDNEISKPLQ